MSIDTSGLDPNVKLLDFALDDLSINERNELLDLMGLTFSEFAEKSSKAGVVASADEGDTIEMDGEILEMGNKYKDAIEYLSCRESNPDLTWNDFCGIRPSFWQWEKEEAAPKAPKKTQNRQQKRANIKKN